MGTTEAIEPLVHSVVNSTWQAAFHDPRFPADELADIEIELSILTPASGVQFTDEAELISQLRPGQSMG